jgi:murein L,D-transpeptidase YcbB/YkuD
LNRPLKYYKDRLAVNMERLRWQKRLNKGGKYVVVNTAAFMLQAVDEKANSVLEMKICCGSYQNKTPLLASKIAYMQMNPYWNVPKSIVRKEIVPAFLKDPAYFEKHQMKVYDDKGNEVNPLSVKWDSYTEEIPFNVKQEKGEGNSLGRLIFRFPNAFAVYLHDTPSRWAFMNPNRAVSHGCVRLEKPLDFAFFLLKKKDERVMDKIRIAIDLPPMTQKGKELLESPDFKPMKTFSLPETVPLFLDYYTVFLSQRGTLNYCEDTYKFDKPLLKELRKI